MIVQKQVNSDFKGKPAKLTLQARGPYKVLEEAGENTYYVQKIPAIQSLTKWPGKQHVELAMRVEKLPSSLVIHKRVNSMDMRLTQLDGQLANNPLEKKLGFFDFRKCTQVLDDVKFVYVKINEMWNEAIKAQAELEEEDMDDDEEEEDKRKEATANKSQLEVNCNRAQQSGEKHRGNNRNDEARQRQPPMPRKRVKLIKNKNTKDYLRELWKDINTSTNKCFFIKCQNPGKQQADWHLLQIDLDETDPLKVKQLGEYHAQYYIRQYKNSKK
jgi:hypothetical protein